LIFPLWLAATDDFFGLLSPATPAKAVLFAASESRNVLFPRPLPPHLNISGVDNALTRVGGFFGTNTSYESLGRCGHHDPPGVCYAVAVQEPEMHRPPMYYTTDWADAKASAARLAPSSPR